MMIISSIIYSIHISCKSTRVMLVLIQNQPYQIFKPKSKEISNLHVQERNIKWSLYRGNTSKISINPPHMWFRNSTESLSISKSFLKISKEIYTLQTASPFVIHSTFCGYLVNMAERWHVKGEGNHWWIRPPLETLS